MFNKLNLQQVEQTNLAAIETMYLGSFIKDPKRERDFYAQRFAIFKPTDFTDTFSRMVAESINEIYVNNELPTPQNVVNVMSTKNWYERKDIASDADNFTKLNSLISYYQTRGAITLKDFRKQERVMEDAKRARLLSPENLNKVIAEINQRPGTTLDHASDIQGYIQDVMGAHEFAHKTADWDEQKKLLSDLPGQFAEMVGKPRFTFPPHWNLNGFIPVLRMGEKCVVSGGTGDGKSSVANQFAEWAHIAGKNVLVIHMEDSDETILMRQTVRWIGGTFLELERGDPKGRMAQMIKLREYWLTKGGSLTYKYLAGNSIALIVQHIQETAAVLESQDKHLDVVVMDYFQKIDFDSQPGNYVNLATAGAEQLKILAERLKLFMFVVSQETPDANGGKHTAWARALEQKPQIYISLTRQEIKKGEDEEFVTMADPKTGISKRMRLAAIGERSCWLQMHIKKVNNGRQGVAWLFFDGPRFRAFDPEFMKKVDSGEIGEYDVPLLKAADNEFWKRQEQDEEAYRLAYYQMLNPEQKRIEKLRQKEEENAEQN